MKPMLTTICPLSKVSIERAVKGFSEEYNEDKLLIVDCGSRVDGFEAVQLAKPVPTDRVKKGMVKVMEQVLKEDPQVSCILLECTEMPAYADAMRKRLRELGKSIPVYHPVGAIDAMMAGFRDDSYLLSSVASASRVGSFASGEGDAHPGKRLRSSNS